MHSLKPFTSHYLDQNLARVMMTLAVGMQTCSEQSLPGNKISHAANGLS